jgi:hypothetical protein
MSEKSPYTANLCPLSGWFELPGFPNDFGQSVREVVEAMLRRAVRQRTPEHLDGMLSEQQRIDDTIQSAARREGRCFRLRREMPGLRSGQMKLSLQIASSNVDVAHRHLGGAHRNFEDVAIVGVEDVARQPN